MQTLAIQKGRLCGFWKHGHNDQSMTFHGHYSGEPKMLRRVQVHVQQAHDPSVPGSKARSSKPVHSLFKQYLTYWRLERAGALGNAGIG